MNVIELLTLNLVNFMGTKNRTIDFNKRVTKIKGINGCGKTTVYSGVMYLLFGKAIDGSEAKNVRPHDENGNLIHYVDIIITGVFSVNGRSVELKKTTREKYVQKRGQTEKVFQRNECIYEVNGIPKSEKDYKQYIEENFCPEDVFLSCSNAMSFFRLDTKNRRAKLMQLAKEFSDADVVASDKEFEPLSDMLKDGTVEELVTRSKGTIKRLNEQLKTIPARIDEQEKSKVDVDVAELELAKNDLQGKIAEIDGKIADISKRYEEYDKASDGVLEIKFAMSDLQWKANEVLAKERSKIEDEILDKDIIFRGLQSSLSSKSSLIKYANHNIASWKSEIEQEVTLWNTAKKRVFDENSLVCPYCKQEYQEEEKLRLRAEFESQKAKELKSIEEKGNSLKDMIAKERESLANFVAEEKTLQEQIEKVNSELSVLNDKLSELPDYVDVSTTEEYLTLKVQLEEKEKYLENGNNASVLRHQLNDEKADKLLVLDGIKSKISQAQRNVDIDERIAELQAELRNTNQKIADEERMLYLLETFNKKKMEMLTESVNKHFKVVKWRLFTENINGGYQDVCYATVNGTNYEKGLNDSDCLLANIDILQTFQRMNDVSLPIFLDRAESINAERIPKIDGQSIALMVSEDKEMIVESED